VDFVEKFVDNLEVVNGEVLNHTVWCMLAIGRLPFRVTGVGTVNGAPPNRFMLWSPPEREGNLALARSPAYWSVAFRVRATAL